MAILAWLCWLVVGAAAQQAELPREARRQALEGSTTPSRSYFEVRDPKLLESLHIPVKQVWHAGQHMPGFEHAQSDDDMAEMYQWNDADMAPWLKRAPLNMSTLLSLMTSPGSIMDDTRRLVAIRRNKLYWLFQEGPLFSGPFRGTRLSRTCVQPCNQEFYQFKDYMAAFLSGPHKIDFPDVVFYLNVRDYPSETVLPAPLLSYQKNKESEDVLVPVLHDIHHPLYIFPWEHKVDKAFMRATPYCSCGAHQGFVRCARSYFAMRSLYENMSHLVEAGLTTGFGVDNPNERDDDVLLHGPLPALGTFPFADHARYRFLLDTDGMTGSYRASKLMFINSPILKQKSQWFEWYTRSLVDGVHHHKFWKRGKDDVYDVLQRVRNDEKALQEMSLIAMKFAHKYLSEAPRKLYWRRVLQRYKTLFPDMDEWMDAFDWTISGRARGVAADELPDQT